MVEVRALSGTSPAGLFAAWKDAFSDYEMTWTAPELEKTLARRGYLPELSFGAYEGGRLVAFTLNGIGTYNGKMTAYDTGTGTIKEYRGRGLSTKIFNDSLPSLVNAGVEQYLLEVLQHNTAAVSIYTKVGFVVSREFKYYVQKMSELQLNEKVLPIGYMLKQTDLPEKELMMNMWDFVPSWQNSFESIERTLPDFEIVGAFEADQLVGYGITDPGSGDITQLAVDRASRGNGIGSAILRELIKRNRHGVVKMINVESTCAAMDAFMESNGISLKGKQFEMIKDLVPA